MKTRIYSGLFCLVAAAYCLLTVPNLVLAQGTVNFITPDATRRYLAGGSDPGSDWTEVSFNDSTWPAGPARLGFGGDGEQRILPPGHITDYFRHAFTVTDVAAVSNLQVRLKRDDRLVPSDTQASLSSAQAGRPANQPPPLPPPLPPPSIVCQSMEGLSKP